MNCPYCKLEMIKMSSDLYICNNHSQVRVTISYLKEKITVDFYNPFLEGEPEIFIYEDKISIYEINGKDQSSMIVGKYNYLDFTPENFIDKIKIILTFE